MATELFTVSELRANLLKMIKKLRKVPERYIITWNGKPSSVMLSYEEFRSILATLDIVFDKELMKGIDEGIRDKKAGRIKSFEEIFEE